MCGGWEHKYFKNAANLYSVSQKPQAHVLPASRAPAAPLHYTKLLGSPYRSLGWGDGLLRRLPVVLAALKRDTKAGVRTAVLATAPPGNPIWPLSALRFQNPSLIYKLPPNFVQLNGARCLRGWGPHGTSPPDTGFLQFEL